MNGRKVLSRLGWAYTVFFLASTAVQYLIALAAAAAPEPWQNILWNDNVSMILSQASMYLAGFPLCFLVLHRIPAWHRPGERKIRGLELFFLAVFCMGFAYIGNLIGSLMASVWDMARGVQSINPVSDVIQTMNPVVMIAATVIVAPVMEELLFRKLLIDRLIPFGPPANGSCYFRSQLWPVSRKPVSVFLCLHAGNDFCLSVQQYRKDALQCGASHDNQSDRRRDSSSSGEGSRRVSVDFHCIRALPHIRDGSQHHRRFGNGLYVDPKTVLDQSLGLERGGARAFRAVQGAGSVGFSGCVCGSVFIFLGQRKRKIFVCDRKTSCSLE